MLYVFIVLIGAVGLLAYLGIMFNAIPGAMDERLGVLEDLPDKLGEWQYDTETEQGRALEAEGKRLEIRFLLESGSGLLKRQQLVKQVRVRDIASNEIVEVMPELRTPRRRRKA